MNQIRNVAIHVHETKQEAKDAAAQIERGATVRGLTAWRVDLAEPLPEGVDLVVGVGGDGTLLEASRLARPLDIPVIGFSATGELNRSDFGLDRFIQNVSDTVEFRIEIEFLQGSNESSRAAVQQVSPPTAGT